MTQKSVSDHARQFRVYHEKFKQMQGALPEPLVALDRAILDIKGVSPTNPKWRSLRAELSLRAKVVALDETIQAGPLVHIKQVLHVLGSMRSPEYSALRAIDALAPVSSDFLQPQLGTASGCSGPSLAKCGVPASPG